MASFAPQLSEFSGRHHKLARVYISIYMNVHVSGTVSESFSSDGITSIQYFRQIHVETPHSP